MTMAAKTYYPHQQATIDALMKMGGKSVMAIEIGMGPGRHLGKTILVAPQTRTFGSGAHIPPTVLDAPKSVARDLDAVAKDHRIFDPWAEAHPAPYRAEIGGVRLQAFAGSGKGGLDIDEPAEDDLSGPGM